MKAPESQRRSDSPMEFVLWAMEPGTAKIPLPRTVERSRIRQEGKVRVWPRREVLGWSVSSRVRVGRVEGPPSRVAGEVGRR